VQLIREGGAEAGLVSFRPPRWTAPTYVKWTVEWCFADGVTLAFGGQKFIRHTRQAARSGALIDCRWPRISPGVDGGVSEQNIARICPSGCYLVAGSAIFNQSRITSGIRSHGAEAGPGSARLMLVPFGGNAEAVIV